MPVYGTIFFNWSTSSEDRERVKKFLQKDEDGTYPVARKLVELAQYYNFEGYFINQETSMPNNEGYSEEFDNFMRYAKKYAAEKIISTLISLGMIRCQRQANVIMVMQLMNIIDFS